MMMLWHCGAIRFIVVVLSRKTTPPHRIREGIMTNMKNKANSGDVYCGREERKKGKSTTEAHPNRENQNPNKK